MTIKYEILNTLETENIEFVRLQFTDLFGHLKNITVTAQHLEDVIDMSYPFNPHELFGESAEDKTLYLRPDLSTFSILPWNTNQGRIARILCDIITENGNELILSPRHILKEVVKHAQSQGYTFYVDSECEFFMFHVDDNGLPTTVTHDRARYMDSAPLDLGINAKRSIVRGLERMGFDIASFHHEAAPAQHEIVFSGTEALQAADQVVSLRNAVGSIARRNGLHATFMPKPTAGTHGSAMHLTLSLYKNDRNIFNSPGNSDELSDNTKYFIGGILHHTKAMCLITNPLVNSYKRLVSGFDAPQYIDWSAHGGRTLLKVKNDIGGERRIEICLPDSSANPYLSIAICIASGLDGIDKKITPPDEGENHEIRLPETLGEAIRHLEKDRFVRSIFGDEFTDIYLNHKREEWKSYMSQVSKWELDNYLY